MNQLKKIFLGLAVVVALGSIGANNAAAQATCTANSVPTLVRATGIAELTGSIVLSCSTNVTTVAASITDTIQPSAAVITNNPAIAGTPTISIIANSPGEVFTLPAGWLVPAGPVANSCDATTAGTVCETVGTVAGNTITFPVPAMTTACGAPPCLFSITLGVNPTTDAVVGPPKTVGIRANVFASGITFPAQIAALLTSSPAGIVAVTNNFLNVAIPLPGMTATFGTTPALTVCATAVLKGTPTTLVYDLAGSFTATDPVTLAGGKKPTVQTVSVVEGFSSAFVPHLNGAGVLVATGDEGADASQGTRILISLAALPSNVVVVAANTIKAGSGGIATPAGVAAGLELDLVPGAGADGSGGTPVTGGSSGTAIAGATTAGATVITGTTVTYEVTFSNNALTEGITIPIGVYTTGTPAPAGTSTASVGLGPTSTVGTPIASPIPRFGAAPTVGNFVVVVPCLTNIFFPWIANTQGYDTGFAIANTTTDIFGTASQSGSCVYNFFGTNPPSGGTFTTASFGGGVTDTRILSTIAPGFYGYVIIQCNFQMGHGFDFITNGFGGGSVTVGQGGPGLIIFQPLSIGVGAGSRKAAASGVPLGEALGH